MKANSLSFSEATLAKNNVYIEPRENGTFAVMKADAQRASAIRPTQKLAIAVAKEMFPDIKPDISRVRTTSVGKPDQFRKNS